MTPTLCPGDNVLVDVAAYRPVERSLWGFPLGCVLRHTARAVGCVLEKIIGKGENKSEQEDGIFVAPAIGDVIVCRHPIIKGTFIVKRVGAVTLATRTLTLYGDNRAMGESNRGNGLFGDVGFRHVVGKVVACSPAPAATK